MEGTGKDIHPGSTEEAPEEVHDTPLHAFHSKCHPMQSADHAGLSSPPQKMKLPRLKAALRLRGLTVSGKKVELVQRLQASLSGQDQVRLCGRVGENIDTVHLFKETKSVWKVATNLQFNEDVQATF